jgi:hypothetical protein
MTTTMMDVITLAAAWSTFFSLILLCRLAFSGEKLKRLKVFGQGLLMLVVLIVLGYLGNWVHNQPWQWLQSPESLPVSQFVQFLVVLADMAIVLIYGLAMFGLLLGHVASLMMSVVAGDFDVWSYAN